MGGGISSSEVFPSELSVHTTIAEADMTGHFENFIIFFQDIGHDAFCSWGICLTRNLAAYAVLGFLYYREMKWRGING